MSTLNVSNISDGTTSVGTSYVVNGSAKAWVNFNGQGTIAARDSFNVASLTDNGTGDYSINFSNNMSNANYAVSGSVPYATWGATVQADFYGESDTSSRMNSVVIVPYSAYYDGSDIYTTAHGDLA